MRLRDAGQLGTRAASLLAGLYFDVAWRLACAASGVEAIELRHDAARRGLVRMRELREGDVMLELARRDALRPLLLRDRFWRWSADLHHTPSKTLLRAWAAAAVVDWHLAQREHRSLGELHIDRSRRRE